MEFWVRSVEQFPNGTLAEYFYHTKQSIQYDWEKELNKMQERRCFLYFSVVCDNLKVFEWSIDNGC